MSKIGKLELDEELAAQLRSIDEAGGIETPLMGDEHYLVPELGRLGLVECIGFTWRLTPNGDEWCHPTCAYCGLLTGMRWSVFCPWCAALDAVAAEQHDRDHMPGRV